MRNRKCAVIIVILLVSLLVCNQVLAARKGGERRRRAAAVAEQKTPAAREIDRRPAKMDQLLSERKERPGKLRRGVPSMPSERGIGWRSGCGYQQQRHVDRPLLLCGWRPVCGCQCCVGRPLPRCGRRPGRRGRFPRGRSRERGSRSRGREGYQGACPGFRTRSGFGEPGAHEGFNIRRPFRDRDAGEVDRPKRRKLQDKDKPGNFASSFEKILEKADTDNDGSLSAEELKALKGRINKRRQRRPGRGE